MAKKQTNSKPKSTEKLNIKQQSTLRTAHMCITMHDCGTQYSTQQF